LNTQEALKRETEDYSLLCEKEKKKAFFVPSSLFGRGKKRKTDRGMTDILKQNQWGKKKKGRKKPAHRVFCNRPIWKGGRERGKTESTTWPKARGEKEKAATIRIAQGEEKKKTTRFPPSTRRPRREKERKIQGSNADLVASHKPVRKKRGKKGTS